MIINASSNEIESGKLGVLEYIGRSLNQIYEREPIFSQGGNRFEGDWNSEKD